jgi:two-component system, OmpR family, sensor histidine kinase ChvG
MAWVTAGWPSPHRAVADVIKFLHSIRGKLLLVSLVLLAIPVLGYRFISDMENFLREGQEQSLAGATRAVAATLSDRPQLFARTVEENLDQQALERRKILALFSSSDPETVASLGAAYVPSEEIERILELVARSASRIWVVDTRSRVRGLAGSLKYHSPGAPDADSPDTLRTAPGGVIGRTLMRWARLSGTDAKDDPARTAQAVMAQVDRALIGVPSAYWRYTQDRRGVILSAAQPIWAGDNIVGAVVVEETTGAIQLLKLDALENLLTITLIVFVAGFVSLLLFASRLAARVRRLGREAETAIDAQGRIRGAIAGSDARDEIGDLSRSLAAVVRRLKDYNAHLESMAGRLSHELRTPVAVVRSSLDNLKLQSPAGGGEIYIARADEGVRRLSTLIGRLAEATQLERFLQDAERERFDLRKVIEGCVEGYRAAYPEQIFQLDIDSDELQVEGVPDAIAQLLDKLVANAMDFCLPGTAVEIAVHRRGAHAVLSVSNLGPPLPGALASTLFSSMVSVRPEHQGQREGKVGHLGLGLYIARLIAEFHNGAVKAENRRENTGVTISITLPVKDAKT